jgi:Flp pilus assembly pilin Flp
MHPMQKDKSKRPWGGFEYLILVVVAILVGYFVVLPIGQEVRGVFQKLTNAFQGK